MKIILSRKKFFLIIALAAVLSVVGLMLLPALRDESTAPELESPMLVAEVDGLLAGKTIEDMIEESSLVVYGKVTGRSDAFQVLPVTLSDSGSDGTPVNYTDVYFKPVEIFRGETDKEQLSIRIMGGAAGGINYIVDDEPELRDGVEYVLFLYQPGIGGGYNTEGDYYYVCGAMQGCFEKTGDNFVSRTNESFTLDNLNSMLNRMRGSCPVDYEFERKSFLNSMKLNLESGFITQEEYDRFLAESEIYATIVE